MIKLLIFFSLISLVFSVDDELVSVVVIYRHGDRTPIKPYPTDPYKNASYWPVGFGQLTNEGKMQQYELGQWLRNRYNNFLSPHYSEKDIYIRSTDVDRTLMSAEVNLAGLYPPKADQVWNSNIPWQPIPIHTIPEQQDALLAAKKPCPKYDKLLHELFKMEFFNNISHKNHDLYSYLTRYSGTKVANLENLEYLYNILYIENKYNMTLPEWTKSVFPDTMKAWAELSFAIPCYTPSLARLKTGLLFNEIIQHFENATKKSSDYRKFLAFSGHDITIANVLNTMGAFEHHCPPYASAIIFELHRIPNDFYYITTFYKNSTKIQNVLLKGCIYECSFYDFKVLLQPIIINQSQWEDECYQWDFRDLFTLTKLELIILSLVSLTGLILFIFGIIAASKCYRKFHQNSATIYMQLPNEEVA